MVILVMMGSRISAGRSERISEMASRTSETASVRFFSRRNCTVVVTEPSITVLYMFSMPVTVAMVSSTLRATCVSSWAGAAPGWAMVTTTTGKSMSGKSCTMVLLNAISPATVSRMKSSTAGIGLRME